MIRATTTNLTGEVETVVLGLSRLNTEKLLAGQPIVVRLRDLRPDLPDLKVLLLGGETEDDLLGDLRVMGPLRDTDNGLAHGGDHTEGDPR